MSSSATGQTGAKTEQVPAVKPAAVVKPTKPVTDENDLKDASIVTKYQQSGLIAEKVLGMVLASLEGRDITSICKEGNGFIRDAVKGIYKNVAVKGVGFPVTCSVGYEEVRGNYIVIYPRRACDDRANNIFEQSERILIAREEPPNQQVVGCQCHRPGRCNSTIPKLVYQNYNNNSNHRPRR
jgi:hypothetical protein